MNSVRDLTQEGNEVHRTAQTKSQPSDAPVIVRNADGLLRRAQVLCRRESRQHGVKGTHFDYVSCDCQDPWTDRLHRQSMDSKMGLEIGM